MEQHFNKILSRKVKAVEQIPVRWNKSDVWAKLEIQLQGNETPKRWYRYAAIVAFVILIFSPGIRNEPGIVSVSNIDPCNHPGWEIADTISKAHKPFSQPGKGTVLALSVFHTKQKPDKRSVPETEIHPGHKRISPDTEKTDSLSVNEIKPPALVTTNPVAVIAIIEPIIGVYDPEEETETGLRRTKKRRLHKLEASKSKGLENDSRNFELVARIK